MDQQEPELEGLYVLKHHLLVNMVPVTIESPQFRDETGFFEEEGIVTSLIIGTLGIKCAAALFSFNEGQYKRLRGRLYTDELTKELVLRSLVTVIFVTFSDVNKILSIHAIDYKGKSQVKFGELLKHQAGFGWVDNSTFSMICYDVRETTIAHGPLLEMTVAQVVSKIGQVLVGC